MKYRVAFIEDDQWFSEAIKYYLELNENNEVIVYPTANQYFNSKQTADIVCVDYHLHDMKGDEVVHKILEQNPNLPIILVSAQEDMQTTVDLLKRGVKDYIIKSEHAKDLIWKSIEEVKENAELKKTINKLEKKLATSTQANEVKIIGNHPSVLKIKNLVQKAAESQINVSITGETGTGKEIVAQQIHQLSDRNKENFIAVNMGALPSELVESELFGYEKGAFTGAVKSKKGKFELAHNGTLFLDEIAELDLNLQAKILRALQEKEITPLGSEKPKKLNIRLIVASHKNLGKEVEKGNFREDLFYRIIGLPIHLPSLRERGSDVFTLANYFLKEFTNENGLPEMELSKKAKEKINNHPFPGNIRELKSVIELAAVLCENNIIQEEDIKFNSVDKSNEFLEEGKSLKELTDKIILHYLEKNEQNVMKTAKQLDIGKSTIYNLLNRINEGSNV